MFYNTYLHVHCNNASSSSHNDKINTIAFECIQFLSHVTSMWSAYSCSYKQYNVSSNENLIMITHNKTDNEQKLVTEPTY